MKMGAGCLHVAPLGLETSLTPGQTAEVAQRIESWFARDASG
jgi:hypothetical protein